jgi:hypothetical protein
VNPPPEPQLLLLELLAPFGRLPRDAKEEIFFLVS